MKVIGAIARRDNLQLLVDGMTAANDLGLTNCVPGQVIVHVSTRLKPIMLGKSKIIFRQTAPGKMYWANRPSMRIVQALRWLRDVKSDDELLSDLRRVANTVQLRDLRDGAAYLPIWFQRLLVQIPR